MEPWQLEGFTDHIQRWRVGDSPTDPQVVNVAQYFTDVLREEPFSPMAKRLPAGVEEFGPEFWYQELPYGSDGHVLICTYRVDATNRVITCVGLGEIPASGISLG